MTLPWHDRPCLVTGGAGFGGAHLCEQLLQRGAKVYVYDRWLSPDSYLVRNELVRRVHFIAGDIQDQAFFKLILGRYDIDTVFHLAAQPIVPISNAQPWETLNVNVMGAYAVLESVRTAAPACRLVFASSGAYYGATTTDEPIAEDCSPANFTNVYAASKVAADVAVRTYAQVYGLRAAVCRFMNTYGPGDTNFSRIVPRALRNLLRGEPYDFGDRDDGSTCLDFLHIRDMAAAYLAVADHLDDVAGEAFNIGTGKATSLRALTVLISELFDGERREPIFGPPRERAPAIKYLDIRKAERLLHWSPTMTLESGLRETIAWYRQHWKHL